MLFRILFGDDLNLPVAIKQVSNHNSKMYSAYYSNDHDIAFVIDKSQIEKLHALFSKEFNEVTITIRCADKVIRKYDILDEFLKFENATNKKIRFLEIEGAATGKFATLSLNAATERKPISLAIRGSDDFVAVFKEKLEDIITGLKPWYSAVAMANIVTIMVAILCVAIVSCLLFIGGFIFIKGIPKIGGDETFHFEDILFGGLLGLAPQTLGYVLNIIKRIVFPVAFFKLGQQVQVFESIEPYQKALRLSTIILGMLAIGFAILKSKVI